MDVSEKIKLIRDELGENQSSFGARLGVSLKTQQNYEQGKRLPTFEYLQRMADMGYDVLYLLTGRRTIDDGLIQIPRMSATGSIGLGIPSDLDHDSMIEAITVDVQVLREMIPAFSNTANLRIITAVGDSMKPTFRSGDSLLVDIGVDTFIHEAVYVIEVNDRLWIKRLQPRLDGAIDMLSDNDKYPAQVITDRDSLRVIGRVLGCWKFDDV